MIYFGVTMAACIKTYKNLGSFFWLAVCLAIMLISCLSILIYYRDYILKQGVRKSFEQSADIILNQLASGQPYDVIVGSSWGGAIALHVLAQRKFHGPVIALCPAYQMLFECMYAGSKSPTSSLTTMQLFQNGARLIRRGIVYLWRWCFRGFRMTEDVSNKKYETENDNAMSSSSSSSSYDVVVERIKKIGGGRDKRVLIIHGDKDTVVPLEHSERLVHFNPSFKLLVVKNQDHRLNDFANSLVEIVKKVHSHFEDIKNFAANAAFFFFLFFWLQKALALAFSPSFFFGPKKTILQSTQRKSYFDFFFKKKKGEEGHVEKQRSIKKE
ncbi:hypothetical protein RFI_21051 [Reticulomyxa filosa]|uniref:AB hydrolase-1 domain-containing protein n=1 Tax=Reticulomyxa filosa TaxID=46433 RepID=X6MQM1_RETFI|nr:hypothetical protein RFI_21051 [Reticulomyxa filosa]|eukprot:ETO16303.1 hypothetical protein RFI_21051 [Reticulomyxa filosa]